ncbi:hypothetical protein UFOVP1295_71, partial [uncultured Caudovirales phage]
MSDVVIAGDTSGSITLRSPAVSGSSVLTLPVATDTLVGKATTDTLTNKSIAVTQLTGTLPVANGGTGLTTVPHTVQVFTSGSGTYTLPANCKAIKVTMVGGGGGGGGGGQSSGVGGAGGTSTFGTSFLTAFGGATSGTPTAG